MFVPSKTGVYGSVFVVEVAPAFVALNVLSVCHWEVVLDRDARRTLESSAPKMGLPLFVPVAGKTDEDL